MALNRELRAYFRQNTQVVNPDGSITPGDRFLTKDIPTEDTFKRLFDSCAFVLNKDDKATESAQGLVKFTNGSNAKANITPNDGWAYAASIENLPTVKQSIQTIKTLTAALVTATADPTKTERNDYSIGLSTEFIQFLTNELNTLQSNIDTLEANTPSNTDIAGIQNDITAIQGDILNLQNTQATQGTDITALQGSVTSLDSRVTQNETDIAANTAAIAAINPADNRFLGEIVTLAQNSAPSANWLACDGAAIDRTTYAALFAAIGTSYGAGDGVNTFNLPNFAGKVQRGYKVGDPNFGVGSSGGSDEVTLIANNLPEHTHPLTTGTGDLATYNTSGTDTGTAVAGNSSHTQIDANISLSGNSDVNTTTNQAFDIKNEYLTTFYFIKVQS